MRREENDGDVSPESNPIHLKRSFVGDLGPVVQN